MLCCLLACWGRLCKRLNEFYAPCLIMSRAKAGGRAGAEQGQSRGRGSSSEEAAQPAQAALNSLTKAKDVRARGRTRSCVSSLAQQQQQHLLPATPFATARRGWESEREAEREGVERESESTSTSYANEFVVIAAAAAAVACVAAGVAARGEGCFFFLTVL